MKTFAVTVVALAAVALATPTTPIPKCKPGTYRCQDNSQTHGPGWGVCDVSGNWVVSVALNKETLLDNMYANSTVQ